MENWEKCGYEHCYVTKEFCEPQEQECVSCASICHTGAETHDVTCANYCSRYLQNLQLQKFTTTQFFEDVTTGVVIAKSTELQPQSLPVWAIALIAIFGLIAILLGIFVGLRSYRRKAQPAQAQRDVSRPFSFRQVAIFILIHLFKA
jgi:hypothetical protein